MNVEITLLTLVIIFFLLMLLGLQIQVTSLSRQFDQLIKTLDVDEKLKQLLDK